MPPIEGRGPAAIAAPPPHAPIALATFSDARFMAPMRVGASEQLREAYLDGGDGDHHGGTHAEQRGHQSPHVATGHRQGGEHDKRRAVANRQDHAAGSDRRAGHRAGCLGSSPIPNSARATGIHVRSSTTTSVMKGPMNVYTAKMLATPRAATSIVAHTEPLRSALSSCTTGPPRRASVRGTHASRARTPPCPARPRQGKCSANQSSGLGRWRAANRRWSPP